jgi:hypothetical protein
MVKHSFGKALSEEDVLEIQGVEYRMQPIGMRVMRNVLAKRQMIAEMVNANGEVDATPEQLEVIVELILASVVPDERERLRVQIDESVNPTLLAEISNGLMCGFSDLDPTQPKSSSDGSSPTGPTSTDGAPPTVSTPSTSP